MLSITYVVEKLLHNIKNLPKSINEVRLNLNNPIVYKIGNNSYELEEKVTNELLNEVLKVATCESLYAVGEYVSDGFLSYKNGIRIGLAGTYTIEDKKPKMIKNLSGLVIRIPKEVKGCSKVISRKHFDKNILVVSKPYGGKTTFLRDLARRVSEERQVVVLDERGELYGGGTLDLGKSMVIQGVSKSRIFVGVIRALSPDTLIMDELFGNDDYTAVNTMIRSGVNVIAGIHGSNFEHLPKEISSLFDVKVLLTQTPTVGSVADIKYD